jgi:GNAT superfamily N-acetyltransferase
VTIARVPPPVTYTLRQRVLRPGRSLDAVRLPIDDNPRTAAFAVRDATGAVVATAIVFPDPCPWLCDRRRSWRLRGMATDPAWRGRGIGGRMLAHVLDHVRRGGGEVVWCNARVPARRLYERAGFTVHGDEWDDPDLGPHVAMWRTL